MKNIYKIIKEEYRKFIREAYGEDDFFDKEDEIKREIFQDFLYKNNENFTKNAPWTVVPFARLKKIWEDYMTMGHVRDIRGLEMIEDIMINNTFKIMEFTALAGHTQWGDDEAFEDNIGYFVNEQLDCIVQGEKVDTNQLELPFDNPQSGYVKKEPIEDPCKTTVHPYIQSYIEENSLENLNRNELYDKLFQELKEKFWDYYIEDPQSRQAYITDFAFKPLETLIGQLFRTTNPEEKVIILDKMLNVVHQRSDIAAWFVEGGSSALSQLSGYGNPDGDSVISGAYHMSDY